MSNAGKEKEDTAFDSLWEENKTLDFQLTNLNKGKGSQGLVPLPHLSFQSARRKREKEKGTRTHLSYFRLQPQKSFLYSTFKRL